MSEFYWWLVIAILGASVTGMMVSSFSYNFSYEKEVNNLEIKGVVYAYSSEERQTDDTPFETAYGTRVRDGIVANNCLPQGTVVEIDGRKYEVEDVMNKRYNCQTFDIWMADTDDAWDWGRQELAIVVYY